MTVTKYTRLLSYHHDTFTSFTFSIIDAKDLVKMQIF